MPFGSYNVSKEQAVINDIRLMKECRCDAVKPEGGIEVADTVKAIVPKNSGFPPLGSEAEAVGIAIPVNLALTNLIKFFQR